jgi:hypothetical protein
MKATTKETPARFCPNATVVPCERVALLLAFSVCEYILDVLPCDASLRVVLGDMAQVVLLPDHAPRFHSSKYAQLYIHASIRSNAGCAKVSHPLPTPASPCPPLRGNHSHWPPQATLNSNLLARPRTAEVRGSNPLRSTKFDVGG